jgi:hypothetical protein
LLLRLNKSLFSKDALMNATFHKQLSFGSLFGKQITADFDGGHITSDAGGLLLRPLGEGYGLTDMIVIDIDATDDPIHGQRQLSFFHGYYEEHMYHPLCVFDGISGFSLTCMLRPEDTHASHRSKAVLKRLIKRLKKAYLQAEIVLRPDAGFTVPRPSRLPLRGDQGKEVAP